MEVIVHFTKDDEKNLLQCGNFYDLLERALFLLEQEDHYHVVTPLRDVHSVVAKLVTAARQDIVNRKLKAIVEKHNANS